MLVIACRGDNPIPTQPLVVDPVGEYQMSMYNGMPVPSEDSRTLQRSTHMLGGSIRFSTDGTFEERRRVRTVTAQASTEATIPINGTYTYSRNTLTMLVESNDRTVLFSIPATFTDNSVSFTWRVEANGDVSTFSFVYRR